MADLLALSFLQPWLWAILEQHKGITLNGAFHAIENRTWKPPRLHLGHRLALHASLGYDAEGAEFVDEQLIVAGNARHAAGRPAGYVESPPKVGCVRGAILGTAVLLGAFRTAGSRADVSGPILDAVVEIAATSPWAFGPWVWLLSDVRKLATPVPCKGALGFWKVPDDVSARVLASDSLFDGGTTAR